MNLLDVLFELPDLPGAACKGLPEAETFFPQHGRSDMARAAKVVCARCPVIEPCLEWALTHDVSGVWGGTTDNERRRIRILRGLA